VNDHMEGDTASEASQENEDTPQSDIVQSSKLKLSSDLENSLKFTNQMSVLSGMIGTDFTLKFYGSHLRCHKFILAARSKVFLEMFMANPMMSEFKFEEDHFSEEVANSMLP